MAIARPQTLSLTRASMLLVPIPRYDGHEDHHLFDIAPHTIYQSTNLSIYPFTAASASVSLHRSMVTTILASRNESIRLRFDFDSFIWAHGDDDDDDDDGGGGC